MDPIYRLLGITAYSTEAASRTSGNGIPVNWLIMNFLGIFCGITINEALEVKRNEGDPISTTIGQAGSFEGRYITLTGSFYPEGWLVKVDKKGKPMDEEGFMPLVDLQRRNAIYVMLDEKDYLDRVIRPVKAGDMPLGDSKFTAPLHVSGMLRTIDSDLSKDARLNSRPIGDARVDDQHMLVAQQKPGKFAMWVAIASVLALLILLMLCAVLKRYVIFRPQSPPRHGIDLQAIAPNPDEKIDLRVTAKFYLDDKLRQRFHRVSSVIADLENGDTALLANVDASVNWMGTKTEDRSGIWAAVIAKGTLSEPQYGILYFGLTAYPAFRIRFTDPIRKTAATAILASTTAAGRERIRQALYEPRPAPAATVPSATAVSS
jgi:hypothetical protein